MCLQHRFRLMASSLKVLPLFTAAYPKKGRLSSRKESPADTLSVYALVNVYRILNCVPIGRAVPIKGGVAIANHRPVDVGYKIRQAMLDHVIPATPQFSK